MFVAFCSDTQRHAQRCGASPGARNARCAKWPRHIAELTRATFKILVSLVSYDNTTARKEAIFLAFYFSVEGSVINADDHRGSKYGMALMAGIGLTVENIKINKIKILFSWNLE